jgi:SAM-dependent methyltransferase
MAHADQFDFVALVKQHLPAFFAGGNLLEVGSLDISGSVRQFFAGTNYTGVDVAPGKGVDVVAQGQLLAYPSGSFDVGISCECLEHNPFWVETVSNMFRMTRPGGLVIISCATTGRAEHGTTRSTKDHSPLTVGIGWEYYRNIGVSTFRQAFVLDRWFEDYILLQSWNMCDLYFVGIMKSSQDRTSFAALRSDLKKRFTPFQNARTFFIWLAVTLFGEHAMSARRTIAQAMSLLATKIKKR